MADSSILTLGTARSLLVDTSVYDSRIAETTKDHVFLGMACNDEEDMLPKVETRVVLVGAAGRNGALVKALQAIRVMEVPVVKIREGDAGAEEKMMIKSIVNMDINTPCILTDDVQELGDGENTDFETVFVLADFDSPDYNYLYKRDNRIVGPPVVLHCAAKEEPLQFSCRPLYCTTMLNLSLCFTGFRNKEEMKKLVNLVHHMGGTIRKDFSTKVTHLIAYSTHGEKYRLAVCMGTPILTPSWIHKAWERRDEVHFCAGEEEFRTEFKVPPFQDCILSFLGFSDEEKANMEERTLKHGGSSLQVGDERCTHMVVEENSVKELPFSPKKLYVVKQEWFWGSIQMDARAGESMYFYEKNDSPAMKKAVSLLSLTTPNSNRKRRRLRDTLAQFTNETEISPFPPPRKRPSAEHSLSIGSLLDISNTPETCKALADSSKPSKSSTPVLSKQSARWQVSKELYQTESNYVDILSTIIQLFKLPLEKEGQVGGPILAQEEMKTIFGSIPEIYDVHTRIKGHLQELLTDWSEDRSVGDIILKYSKELVKAYPPFVNFFEMSKETIVHCEKQKPRFHAFLKINQSKPDCGRQTLVELLIRPVQRLPSVALLLNDIKKHTSDDNPDKITLEKAIESLKEVMTHINEDKRRTEGQKQIFDVVYEVVDCPANLLSSHRTLVHRVETIALGDQPCDRGEHVTLFLFNDCLEIARKRHKVINTFKSPLGQTRPPPPLKHIALMPLSQIRRVLDLQDTEECVNAFALVVHPPTEQENLLFSFQLAGEETVKSAWLRTLCRHVANTICKADAEDLIQCTDPDSLHVTTKDMDSTLSKASRAIKKTSKKVTRAFSFTKTPKRAIQRAFMANSTPDEKTQRLSCENRLGSSSTLAMSRSASTFSLSDSAKSSAVVQRSNSLDHPPVRARVPVCIRTPSSPPPNPAPEFNESLHPFYCPSTQEPKSILHAPLLSQPAPAHSGPDTSQQSTTSTLPNSTSIPAVRNFIQLNSKSSQPKSSQHVSRHLPSVGFQARFLANQPVNVIGRTFSESYRDPQAPLDPCKAALTSPRRETLL
ncbi:protein ECT2 isoform X1 [Anarrhichthys ocellatus]|uniref:protein ECT2 isoform X1 n=1 Tax=Anarrhichthys ocellatus TaxID=433405 RepID=UPI0012ECFC8A|nr:protein ECT2 isoform X1 [Anarrhichthys ocellatus]XP_031733285.1 protein ECT2 isoform X1 [Anarrhichthys ocellatus]XP_031733287.1 protein ECT2 isoform X1 [Anarrhichthys ocellatus]XP_031733288.1 protein ECT2 isoform X1 [Anarrhichthys ocellatus]